ncbi:DUF6520 family protein [Dyadobacter frigoris]|uniref:DUF3551 domain-containing protein n=1 Tax=Dyadobacter frigoris TaxID=2576211 RepID=A0A4U6CMC3_9BACT|nr:DUF6520 family protein [Dyadobacter frigoris]TKT85492.1 hypothetical protein FDK13_33795 [Dyadobacter frigoris]GLU56231.1 hypothetical protein Dfri01_56920 [Dyadobacter frigoris]
MKTKKLMLSIAAFAFATIGAFATRTTASETVDSLWRQNASEPEICESQSECSLTSGQACSFQSYSDATCSTPVTRFKP